ncbi:MAG TPA: outer membrane beta-barrel protein, partial [Puia sp.]
MRKKLLTLGLSTVFAIMGMAQAPAKPAGPAARAGGPPSIGRAFGKVTDSTGQPMEATALVLKSTVDASTKKKKLVLLKGMDTKGNGEFNFEDLPISIPLVLRTSATGYKSEDLSFTITNSAAAPKPGGSSSPYGNLPSFDKDLGSIKLKADVKMLNSVVVTSSTPTMKLELDKKVFNVEKNIVSAGGTGLDVMRNVPSVNVDIDGNVTLRGSKPTIFVDGRPTTLTLDEIPADAIESVEVMTNPSAKYDASGGGAGILNIVLKKNKKKGYNGSITAGMDSHGAPNALAGVNVRQGKINVTANGMINGMNGKTTGNTERFTYLGDTTRLLQQDLNRNKGHFMFGQIGLDYFVSNKTTLSASYIKVHGKFKPTDVSQIQTDSLSYLGNTTGFSQRNSNSVREFDVNGVQLGMKHIFDKEGEQITADGSYFGVNAHSTSLYTTNYYSGQPGSAVSGITRQQMVGTADPAFFTVQTDYTDPVGKSKLEAGLRASVQKLGNKNDNFTLDKNGDAELNAFGSSNYRSSSQVYAGYVNFTSAVGKFGYSLGLRAESSSYSGDLLNTGQHFSNTYPVSIFPTLFLSQKLENDQELQFSATRKINRPGFFQLIPFTDYSDTLNITRGNPDLVPEFTESFEMTYMKSFQQNHTILFSGYYKYT